jgi:hypothetical protein
MLSLALARGLIQINESCATMMRHHNSPANNAPGVKIHHYGKEQPAMPRPDEGYIRRPSLVDFGNPEVLL